MRSRSGSGSAETVGVRAGGRARQGDLEQGAVGVSAAEEFWGELVDSCGLCVAGADLVAGGGVAGETGTGMDRLREQLYPS